MTDHSNRTLALMMSVFAFGPILQTDAVTTDQTILLNAAGRVESARDIGGTGIVDDTQAGRDGLAEF